MQTIRTVNCKLVVTPAQALEIDAVLKAFADACAWIHQTIDPNVTNAVRMQALVYREVREQFGLSANLTIRAIARVCGARKAASGKGRTVREFKPTSVAYDARIFGLRESDMTVSLTLLGGRRRFNLAVGDFQRAALRGQSPTSATLVKRRDGTCFLNIQVKSDAPEPDTPEGFLGVDLGRRDIAHLSDGQSFSGSELTKLRDRFSRTRASLQKHASKGTRSSRRRGRQLLTRLSGREARFQKHVNHVVSKRIVQTAKAAQSAIVMEDLTGIRLNVRPKGKTETRRTNAWAFHQLRLFVAYKSLAAGVELRFVPPAYTSQCCRECLHIGQRSGKKFACTHCGLESDADFNAANVIALLGAALVNPPGGPVLACRWPARIRAAESSPLKRRVVYIEADSKAE